MHLTFEIIETWEDERRHVARRAVTRRDRGPWFPPPPAPPDSVFTEHNGIAGKFDRTFQAPGVT